MFRIVCLLFEHPDVNTLNILLKPMRHDLCPTLFLQISQRGFASFTLLLYLFVFPLLLPVFKSRYSTKMSRHCISLKFPSIARNSDGRLHRVAPGPQTTVV